MEMPGEELDERRLADADRAVHGDVPQLHVAFGFDHRGGILEQRHLASS
jgi:hypothetical protein